MCRASKKLSELLSPFCVQSEELGLQVATPDLAKFSLPQKAAGVQHPNLQVRGPGRISSGRFLHGHPGNGAGVQECKKRHPKTEWFKDVLANQIFLAVPQNIAILGPVPVETSKTLRPHLVTHRGILQHSRKT